MEDNRILPLAKYVADRMLTFIIIIFITLSTSAQSWQYGENSDPFDGKYSISYVTGTGGKFPYETPVLKVVVYESQPQNPSIYLTDVPSSICDGKVVQFKFDGDPQIFTQIANGSRDGDAWFIRFSNELKLTSLELPPLSDSIWGTFRAVDYVVSDYLSFTIRLEANSWSDILLDCEGGDTVKILNFDKTSGYWLVLFNNPLTQNGGIGFVKYNSTATKNSQVAEIYNNPQKSSVIIQELKSLQIRRTSMKETELETFIRYIKTYSKMYVRMISDCVSADYVFSLSGSTAAMNYVFKK